MTPLISPTLFAIARLGLFLAVAASIMGQWWEVQCRFYGTKSTALTLAPEGCLLEYNDNSRLFTSGDIESAVRKAKVPSDHSPLFDHSLESATIYTIGSFPGLTVKASTFGGKTFIAFRHGLNILTFLFLNLLLHFIYRKRPEAEPCES